MQLSPLYAILDAESCGRRGFSLVAVAEAWRDAGVRLMQYRDKQGSDAAVLQNATAIRAIFAATDAVLLLNDRVHLLVESGWHGVHIGQTDLSPQQARQIIGADKILGVSTHTPEQVQQANEQPVDYIAIGPVFGTTTKLDAEPVVGLEGVRNGRALTQKPLVAIGGITRSTAQEVEAAGADSVAVISALLPPAGSPPEAVAETARDFLAAFK